MTGWEPNRRESPLTVFMAGSSRGGEANPLVHVLNVPDSVTIADLNVALGVDHSWVGDLVVTLEHNGTEVTLIDRTGVPFTQWGCSGNNFHVELERKAATAERQ